MSIQHSIIKYINKYFNYAKIATLEQVQKKIDTNVRITTQRYLKKLEYFTSYSHSGKYYTHKRFITFNSKGLWTYKGVHFSVYGKLTETIKHLIFYSKSGYNSIELQNLLYIKVSDTLLKLVNDKKLFRQKISGKYYYFSNVIAIRKAQLLLCRSKVEIKFANHLDKKIVYDTDIKQGFALFFNQLDEKQKRLYSGLESALLGYGGDKIIAETFGLDPHTVSKGRHEILSGDFEKKDIRHNGGGRKSIKKKPRNN